MQALVKGPISVTVLIGDGREFQWLVEEWFRGSVRVMVRARAREYFFAVDLFLSFFYFACLFSVSFFFFFCEKFFNVTFSVLNVSIFVTNGISYGRAYRELCSGV